MLDVGALLRPYVNDFCGQSSLEIRFGVSFHMLDEALAPREHDFCSLQEFHLDPSSEIFFWIRLFCHFTHFGARLVSLQLAAKAYFCFHSCPNCIFSLGVPFDRPSVPFAALGVSFLGPV